MLRVDIEEKKFDTVLFENLKIKFPRFGLVVIKGESGCGKTTLLNMICHLDTDYKGKIEINGKKMDETLFQEMISYGYASYYLLNDLSVKDYYKLYGIQYDLGLIDFDLKLKVGELSRGQKQRLTLLISLVQNKPILLLDEITSGLDENYKQKVIDLIVSYSKNHLVIMVDHDLDCVKKVANHTILLDSNMDYDLAASTFSYSKMKTNLRMLKKEIKRYKKSQLYMIGINLFIILFGMILLFFSTNTFSASLKDAIFSYFPDDSYSFHYEYFDCDTLDKFEKDQYIYLCLDDVELLGIQKEEQIYPVDDYSKSIRKLVSGTYPNENNEIVVGEKIMDILDLKISDVIHLSYLIEGKREDIPYHIVGTSIGNELYFKEYGEYLYLNTFKKITSSFAIVVIIDQESFEKELKDCTIPNMKIGEGFMKKVDDLIDKVKLIVKGGMLIGGVISFIVLIDLIALSMKKREKIIGLMYLNGFKKKEVFYLLWVPYQKIIFIVFYLVNFIYILLITLINMALEGNLQYFIDFYYILMNLILFVFIEVLLLLFIRAYMKKKPIDVIQKLR